MPPNSNRVCYVLAFVAFVIASVLCFASDTVNLSHILGAIAIGLAVSALGWLLP